MNNSRRPPTSRRLFMAAVRVAAMSRRFLHLLAQRVQSIVTGFTRLCRRLARLVYELYRSFEDALVGALTDIALLFWAVRSFVLLLAFQGGLLWAAVRWAWLWLLAAPLAGMLVLAGVETIRRRSEEEWEEAALDMTARSRQRLYPILLWGLRAVLLVSGIVIFVLFEPSGRSWVSRAIGIVEFSTDSGTTPSPSGSGGTDAAPSSAPPPTQPGGDLEAQRLAARVRAELRNDELWGDLGDAYGRAGDGGLASGAYAVAHLLDPVDSEWTGHSFRLTDAAEVLRLLTVGDDEFVGDLGDAAAARGDHMAARALYQLALSLDPDDSEWLDKTGPGEQGAPATTDLGSRGTRTSLASPNREATADRSGSVPADSARLTAYADAGWQTADSLVRTGEEAAFLKADGVFALVLTELVRVQNAPGLTETLTGLRNETLRRRSQVSRMCAAENAVNQRLGNSLVRCPPNHE